jgi:molecular chaperone GrpE
MMKHKKDPSDVDDEDTKEFIFSDSKSETETIAETSDDTVFEVSEASLLTSGKQKSKETAEKKPEEANSDQDALFEVSQQAASACDDDAPETPAGKSAKANAEDGKKDGATLDKKKIDELSAQLAAANDKYLRLMAEFDNFKRRSAKEYERMIEAANEKLMKDITEVRENFERAFKSNATGDKFLEGMKLIFTKLNTILQKHGLETYAETGQKFDPELHDALMRMPHEKIEEGHVVEVHERGYKLKGNIIKHAKVVVSSGTPPKKETADETVIEIK